MRKFLFLCAACLAIAAPAPAFAAGDPRPGSAAVLDTLVHNYSVTIDRLFQFEGKTNDVLKSEQKPNDILKSEDYLTYRQQVLETVLFGLYNIDTPAAHRLILELSALPFDENIAPMYSCIVQHKAKKLAQYIKKNPLPNRWCSGYLLRENCYEKEYAIESLREELTFGIANAKNLQCILPIHWSY